MRTVRDISYARASQHALLLDLYLPDGLQHPLPVVVWIHGGAWREGNKENPPVLRLVTRGYAAASIDYRLSQQAVFPAQVHDCKAAIRWLRANAETYGLDPNHIGVWGHSAGGHLVALLGTTGAVRDLEGDLGNHEYSSNVQAVCDYSGPTDFCRMDDFPGAMTHNAPDSPESKLVGGPIQDHPVRVAAANPITYAGADAAPFLIVHGRVDPLVPVNQAELLYKALQQVGADVSLHIVEGAGHGFHEIDDVAMVNAFFDKHLKHE